MEISHSPILICLVVLLALPCDGGQFWHISDLHLDYAYVKGGNKSNNCHAVSSSDAAKPSINHDIVGPAGNYNCDSPEVLVESALLAMARIEPNPDFIVWTGDSAPHVWEPPPTEEYIFNVTKHVFTRLDKLFPNVTIIPALGNHDASPPDQFPQYDPEVNKSTPEFYNNLWKNGAFGDHIDSEGMETFNQCGYYSKVVKPKNSSQNLRFIVLNTNLYYHDKFSSGPDPCGQLNWFNETLIASDQEKVFIVAHVPPGSYEKSPGRSNFNTPEEFVTDIHKRYIQLVTDPSNVDKISAHLYGHLHTDTFRVFLDRATKRDAVGVAFMAGSVTPVVWAKGEVVGVNPTVRLFEFDDTNTTVTDYKEYSLDIIKAAKNESVDNPDENVIPKLETSDSSQSPKNRRKNAKFLEQSEIINTVSKTKRDTMKENPEDAKVPSQDGALAFTPVPAVPPTDGDVELAANGSSPNNSSNPDLDSPINNKTASELSVEGVSISADKVEDSVNKVLDSEDKVADSVDKTGDSAGKVTDSMDKVGDSADEVEIVTNEIVKNNSDVSNTSTSDANTPVPNVEDYPTYLSKQWTLLYSARKSFSVKDLSPASMFSALAMMVNGRENSSMFQSYYEHNTGGHIVGKCNETCWREQLCTVSNLDIQELKTCLNSSGIQGFYEVAPTPTLVDNSSDKKPTTTTLLGEGDNDPDKVAQHGEIDNELDQTKKEEMDDSKDVEGQKNHEESPKDVNDGNEDNHYSEDHADHFPVSDGEDVSKEKVEDDSSNITSRAVAIFFGVFAVAIVALVALMGYKKYRDNRYRNQEFLLTDAVFRYDGYSQLEDP